MIYFTLTCINIILLPKGKFSSELSNFVRNSDELNSYAFSHISNKFP